tara:strand:- start:14180 stop:16033 length:1854 start_codon:yes stop_codon:yes gene_type:complete
MAQHKLEVSELDFDKIKVNLKTFLQSQTQFQDYDFDGAGLSILLDVLSYNTHYLSYIANMSTNEMYLDSADIRKNIVSLAKMLGYTPTSPRTPRAVIDVVVNNATGSSVTMQKGTVFTTTVDKTDYQYVTNADTTISPVNGIYKFEDVTVYEGTLVTFKYTNDVNDKDQKFVIPSSFADTSTLKVTVQNSSTDTTQSVYSLAGGYNSVSSDSKVYFIQEGQDGQYEIYFGDGIVGTKLEDGNIVILEYIVTNTSSSNGASKFSLSGNIGGFTNVTITTDSNSQGGAIAETNQSIKFNAPLQYAAQDRAVTATDYETLVKSIYPNANSVSAWGGEDDETPQYGVVNISIKAKSGTVLSDTSKADIVTQLKPYNVASVRPVIKDPETTSVLIVSNVKYDAKATAKTAATLKADIIDKLTTYNASTLQKFDSVFRYSKVTGLIDSADDSILSNITTVKIRKDFQPLMSTSAKYNIYFRNALYNPHSGHMSSSGGILSSSGFRIEGNANECFFDDDGAGNVRLYYMSSGVKNYLNSTQGTINYSTGAITLNSMNIASISNIDGVASTVIRLTVVPSSNDVVPVRDQIVEMDIANSNITVTADSFVGGSAEAGVGYTTTSSY